MKYEVIRTEKLKEEVYFKELETGLKVFLMPRKEYIKKYVIYTTKYGSNDNKFVPIGEKKELEVPEGIAHFLEHKLFEEPEGNVFNDFSKLGSYVNAFTDFNQTAYLFSCTDMFYENLELLVKFVEHPYFTDENVEKEKGIIEQEIKMYNDSPDWKVFFNCLKGMYSVHPVRIDIAGTVESIRKIDKETLYKCYDTFYHPSNMILFMIGDINFEKALDVVNRIHSNRNKKTDYGEIKRIYPSEPKSIHKKIVKENLNVSTPLFNIGFKDLDVGYDGDGLLKKDIITNIILEMIFSNSSEFFEKLYNEGLINNTFRSQYIGYKGYGHSILGGESEEPEKVLERLLEYTGVLKEKGLSQEDFSRVRRKFIGYHLMDLNSLEYVANTFVSYYFNKTSLFRYIEILENINFKEVENRFDNHFREENCTLSVVSPK